MTGLSGGRVLRDIRSGPLGQRRELQRLAQEVSRWRFA